MTNARVSIGGVTLRSDLILAPMAGYGDLPMRSLCAELGSTASIIPCIQDDGLLHDSRHTAELLRTAPHEQPRAIQVLSKDAERLRRAAPSLIALQPDWVDLNLGCPSKHIVSGGRGAALLRQPALIEQLACTLVSILPCPVTAKIRLGWDDATRNYREVAQRLQDAGISALAVHGRTTRQGYSGVADWEAIAEVRELLEIPVIANGDVRTPADIDAIQQATGCQLVMIGRAAVGHPWIFSRLLPREITWDVRMAMIRRHLALMSDTYGPRNGVRLFRKHLTRYVQSMHGATVLRSQLMRAARPAEVLETLYRWRVR